MDADAILEPERKRREKEEHRDIDETAAQREESEQKNIERVPRIVKAARSPDDYDDANNNFLQGLDAEGVKDHLKQRRERSQKDAVKFSLHDVRGAKFVQVQRKNVEETERDEREAIKKYDFFHAPIGQSWNSLEKNENKSE